MTDVAVDPNNPETIYAASYQRRRHMWTLIDGGPEARSTNRWTRAQAGTKVRAGLPTTDMGRIGLAISPVDSNVIYATIEAADRKGGIFQLRQLIEVDLQRLEKQMEAAGAPWTPGRIPEWKDQ